jgi:LuxR family maltose regulon positive regulatory protein
LLDFFATEILERQPEPVQRFLLQTSVLTRLSGPLCDAVTGGANSATQLATIARAGLFLEPLAGPGDWYRYHALFSEAMRREASRRLGEQALRDFSRRASLWYEQENLLTEAIEAAWLSEDLERVARLIEQLDLQNFYEPQTVMHWLERLPEAVLCAHPMLCLVYAIELRFPVELRFSQAVSQDFELPSLSEAQRLRIESLLQMAEEGWLSAGMRFWLGAIRAFRVLSGLVGLEPFSTLVDYARQALVYFPQEEKIDYRLQMWRSTCLLFIGIDDLRLGHIAEARQLLLQAVEDNVPPGNLYLASEIQAMLGKCYLIQGELQQAKKCFRQVMPIARKLADTEMMADILLELAWLAFEWNDLKGAEQQAQEALALAHQLHPPRPELHDRAALQFALLRHVQGETSAALQQLNSLLSGPPSGWTPNSLGLFYRVRDWQGRLRIATGDWLTVQASLDTCDLDHENTSLTERLGVEILRGRLLLAKGDARAALQQFSHLLPLAQEQLHQYAALEIQLLLALAHAACQQDQPAHYWLRQTLLQTVNEGYIRLFLNEGKPVLALLRSLLKTLQHDTTLRSYVQMILTAASPGAGTAQVTAPGSANLPPLPLTNQEQRVLRLLADGKSNQDIAQEMIVSVNTVKYHVKHLYEKLGVSNRQQASKAAHYLKFSQLS